MTIELKEITFDEMQRHFYTLYHTEQADPQEVHIAEADYFTLALSAIPMRRYDSCERDLLGEDTVNEFIFRDEEARRKIEWVLNYCTGAYVRMVRHPEQERGTVYFSGKNDRTQVFGNIFAESEVGNEENTSHQEL